MSWVPGAKTDLGYWGGYRKENPIKYYCNYLINKNIKSLFDSCLFRQILPCSYHNAIEFIAVRPQFCA